jgi:hypothetical protein
MKTVSLKVIDKDTIFDESIFDGRNYDLAQPIGYKRHPDGQIRFTKWIPLKSFPHFDQGLQGIFC